jgi:hypothetical protein
MGDLDAAALQVVGKLEEAKLLPPDGTLGGMLVEHSAVNFHTYR